MKTQFSLNHIRPKMLFYVIEKLCDFFSLRPSDLNTTLTYARMDNFCTWLQIFLGFLMEMLMQCPSRYILTMNKKIYICKWVNETYSTLDWLKSLIGWDLWSKKSVNYLSCIEEKRVENIFTEVHKISFEWVTKWANFDLKKQVVDKFMS